MIVPPKCSMRRTPACRLGKPGIHPVADHTHAVLTAGGTIDIATNAQYPKPAAAIPIVKPIPDACARMANDDSSK